MLTHDNVEAYKVRHFVYRNKEWEQLSEYLQEVDILAKDIHEQNKEKRCCVLNFRDGSSGERAGKQDGGDLEAAWGRQGRGQQLHDLSHVEQCLRKI